MGMSYQELANRILFDNKETDRDRINDILWNMTAFPMAGARGVVRQLKKIRSQLDSGLTMLDICLIQETEDNNARALAATEGETP